MDHLTYKTNRIQADWRKRACELVTASGNAERTYLVSSWYHPTVGHEAACEAKLTGADFMSPEHSALFAFIMLCAKRDVVPQAATFLTACKNAEPTTLWTFHPSRWRDPKLELLDLLTGTQFDARMIGHYADSVRDFADRRTQAAYHLREANRLIGGRATVKQLNARKQKTARRAIYV